MNRFIRLKGIDGEFNKINLRGANVAIVGRSVYIGKSLFHLLVNRDATVTMCHSKTESISAILKKSDIIICAVGKEKFLTRDMISPGVVVVDVGIHYDEEGKMCGDVARDNYSYLETYSPVPRGVGPLTNIALIVNIIF